MAWLGTWENRRKITISNANIDSVLSDFPILVKISASSGTGSTDITDVFTELGSDANRKKIAITTADGTTQCYVEIERFDYANSIAWLWVKVPSVSNSVVTELYVYYDLSQADNTTYIGDTTDAVTHSAWDSNFKLVMHMAQDPDGDVTNAIKDSTSNQNDGTPSGSMTSADLVDGKIGKGIEFDGSNDALLVSHSSELNALTNDFSITIIGSLSGSGYAGMFGKAEALSPYTGPCVYGNIPTAGRVRFRVNSVNYIDTPANSYNDGVIRQWDFVRESNALKIYTNGALCDSKSIGSVSCTTTNPLYINRQSSYFAGGITDEVRFSPSEARSAAWIKATYYSNWDGIVTYSSPEEFFSGEITCPSPFLATSSIQSSVQIEIGISNNPFTSTSLFLLNEIYYGRLIRCPSPFSTQSSLHGTAQVEIAESIFTSNNSLKSTPEVFISNNLFTAASSISIGEIWGGFLVGCPSPFLAQGSLQSIPQIEINQSIFSSTGSLYIQPEIQLFTGSLSATGSILATITDPFSAAILPRVYTFTLTGAADGIDDIVIPIKSFQSRLKSGDPTYLSVVIPGTDYASEINSRLNGDLVIRMGYSSNGEIILSEIISMVNLENIIIYNGATNNTITLDGHRTETFIHKEINLTGSSYRNFASGKLRYRCTPDLYVRPGDTVNIDDDSFTIENITYSVSPELETFEVSE